MSLKLNASANYCSNALVFADLGDLDLPFSFALGWHLSVNIIVWMHSVQSYFVGSGQCYEERVC